MVQRQKRRTWVLAFAAIGAALLGHPFAWADGNLQWAWMKGASTVNQPGTYGTPGIPSAANTPAGCWCPVSWTDLSGALWLFGGYGFGATGGSGRFNCLWKYTPSSGNWTWMKGASTTESAPVYGTRGTPAAANTPGARQGAVSWTDLSGALWLFGGFGIDDTWTHGDLSDLWKFTPATGNWTWMKGSSTGGQPGVYGTPETPAADSTPGGREYPVSWTDSSGALWLFGGGGRDAAGIQGYLNDLWKYTPSTGNWTWVKGFSTSDHSGNYGTPGTPADANTPGGRIEAVSWYDPSGALWLFGGSGWNDSGAFHELNDLWKFTPATGNWTWMTGSPTDSPAGIYGTPGTPAAANTPGARQNAVTWRDTSGALWLFGGVGRDSAWKSGTLNDLWKYTPATGYWTWMNGSSTVNQPGTYGIPGTPSAANFPGARQCSVSWVDPAGALWLFGGTGLDGAGSGGYLNDLWRAAPDSTPPTGTIVVNGNRTATNTPNVTLSLTWDDGVGGSGVTRMRFSNDGSTWSAWEVPVATRAYTLPAGDGYKTVRVQYLDRANNKSAVFSDYIRLDTVPPTGGIIINNGAATTTTRTVALKLNWADTGSGVTRMRFSDNGATWTAWESQKATRAYTLPVGLGYHTVRVQYTDAAENYSPICNDYIKVVAP